MNITLHGIEDSKKSDYIASFAKHAEQYNLQNISVGFDNDVSSYKRLRVLPESESEEAAILFTSAITVDLKEHSTNPTELDLSNVASRGKNAFLAIYPSDAWYILELAKSNAQDAVNYIHSGEQEEQEELEEGLPVIHYHHLNDWVSEYNL